MAQNQLEIESETIVLKNILVAIEKRDNFIKKDNSDDLVMNLKASKYIVRES